MHGEIQCLTKNHAGQRAVIPISTVLVSVAGVPVCHCDCAMVPHFSFSSLVCSYGKAGMAWYISSHQHDVIIK